MTLLALSYRFLLITN